MKVGKVFELDEVLLHLYSLGRFARLLRTRLFFGFGWRLLFFYFLIFNFRVFNIFQVLDLLRLFFFNFIFITFWLFFRLLLSLLIGILFRFFCLIGCFIFNFVFLFLFLPILFFLRLLRISIFYFLYWRFFLSFLLKQFVISLNSNSELFDILLQLSFEIEK